MKHYNESFGIRPGAEEFPLMVVLSYVYACNSRCPNCPYNNSTIRSQHKGNAYMPTRTFRTIAEQAGKYGAFLRLSGGGEPLLHEDIHKHVNFAKAQGCKVGIITNGSKDVSKLVNLADVLEFSVDAGTKEEYEKVRPGLDWDYLNENVRDALLRRRDTKIIVSIINQKGVDVEQAEKYWGCADVVQVRKYLTWGYNENNSADDAPYLPPEKNLPCPWLFERLAIDTTGEVSYCNADIAFKNSFANVSKRTIKEIWTGPEFTEIREKHLAREGHKMKMCAECADWKYRSWNHNYWKILKKAES